MAEDYGTNESTGVAAPITKINSQSLRGYNLILIGIGESQKYNYVVYSRPPLWACSRLRTN